MTCFLPRALALPALCLLAGCAPDDLDGGPCRYDAFNAHATVAELDTASAGGDLVVRLEMAYLGDRPASPSIDPYGTQTIVVRGPVDSSVVVGARFPARVDVITEGTCTPVMIDVPGLSSTGR